MSLPFFKGSELNIEWRDAYTTRTHGLKTVFSSMTLFLSIQDLLTISCQSIEPWCESLVLCDVWKCLWIRKHKKHVLNNHQAFLLQNHNNCWQYILINVFLDSIVVMPVTQETGDQFPVWENNFYYMVSVKDML